MPVVSWTQNLFLETWLGGQSVEPLCPPKADWVSPPLSELCWFVGDGQNLCHLAAFFSRPGNSCSQLVRVHRGTVFTLLVVCALVLFYVSSLLFLTTLARTLCSFLLCHFFLFLSFSLFPLLLCLPIISLLNKSPSTRD